MTRQHRASLLLVVPLLLIGCAPQEDPQASPRPSPYGPLPWEKDARQEQQKASRPIEASARRAADTQQGNADNRANANNRANETNGANEPHEAQEALQRRDARRGDPADGMRNFVDLMQGAEIEKLIEKLQRQATSLMSDQPAAAVAKLDKIAELTSSAGQMQTVMREYLIEVHKGVLAKHEDPKRYFELAKLQFRSGDFGEAAKALSRALELGVNDPARRIQIHCWLSSCARAAKQPELAKRALAAAKSILTKQQRKEKEKPAQATTGRSPYPSSRGRGYGGLRAGLQGDMRQQQRQQQIMRIRQEYYAAKAAYNAERARYDAERQFANQRAGRYGGIGVSINPRPINPAVYSRYLRAKAAYDSLR
jgi:hypothetical protein